LNRVEITDNSINGLYALDSNSSGGIQITIFNSVVADNLQQGLYVDAVTGGSALLTMVQSVAASNGTGLQADDNAVLRLGQSTVTQNIHGWTGVGIQSYGDNYINGNGDSEAAPPSVSKK
jgi:hypothetical protein